MTSSKQQQLAAAGASATVAPRATTTGGKTHDMQLHVHFELRLANPPTKQNIWLMKLLFDDTCVLKIKA
jgi:hypothetical protein